MPLAKRPLMVVTCLLIAGVIAVSQFYLPQSSFSHKVGSQSVCEGFVDSVSAGEEKLKLDVRLHGCFEGEKFVPLSDRVRLTVPGGNFSYGDVIRVQTSFRLPSDFKNPGGFKFKRYCLAHGISALGFVADSKWITKVGTVSGHRFRKFVETWRGKIAASLDGIEDGDVRAVSRALVIGDDSLISAGVKEDFRKSGLMHLLVISGLNVGFVAAFIFFVFRRALFFATGLASRFNMMKPAALFSIASVWVYAFLTGAEVSVVRAAVMATVYLAGIALDRRQDMFTSLSLAALIILAASPLAVFDISFQLSFVAVLAIAVLYPAIIGKFSRFKGRKIFWWFLQTLSVSVAAAVGVTPLLAYYFHYSSFVGIVANIIAVPWAGFVVTPASLFVSAFRWPVEIFGWLVWPLMRMAKFFASVSNLFTCAFTPPAVSVWFFYLAAVLLVFRKRVMFARYLIVACVVISVASVCVRHGFFSERRLEVAFLDVGQGSSIVVRFPDRRVMVIDGGGFKKSDFDVGKFVIAPYLWHKGISRVDWLVATHPHPDHFKGLRFLAEEFSPKMFFWNGLPPQADREEWDEFMAALKIPACNVRDGTSCAKNLPAEILSPPEKIPRNWSENDASIVLKFSAGGKTFLLTGDVEAEAENYLVKGKNLKADVMLVPHHGSLTSSSEAFLKAVSPKFAVVQAGENNRYGFPKPEIVERFLRLGIKLYRTDTLGAVEF